MVQIACLTLEVFRKTYSLFLRVITWLLYFSALHVRVMSRETKFLCCMLQNKLTKYTCDCVRRPTGTSRDAGHKHKQWHSLAILEKVIKCSPRIEHEREDVSLLHFDLPFLSKSCSWVEEVSSGVLQSCEDFNTMCTDRRVLWLWDGHSFIYLSSGFPGLLNN